MEQTTFTDSDGVVWNVREDGADDPRALTADVPPGTTWLRFESELEVRRLWHYPDDWRGLSPIQLESLLDRASTVIARFRPAMHSGAGGRATLDPQPPVPSQVPTTADRVDGPPVDPSRRDKK
ncbi:MAG TPA: hypothetical protein VIK41_23885 [Gemmatimonadaceae bacterium]|jgi:hypothetical protein